ncbi:hypothetical protein HRI_000529300 [Hibiscus trionum]|uniref:Uncharacterized protein n=1 Tax=Hibiscus trionum TaxID=183268 RepID=A0A9W7LMF9_HIBTR|nr:hypothetical protein HRI_000529300 [Hibiscus trionum]
MTGKKHMEGKVTGKNHRKLLQPKPDPKKWKENVKFLAGLAAETTAVQAELMGKMDENLLKLRSDPSPPNLHALQLTEHQLQKVNMLATLMKDEVDDLAAEIIA